MFFTVFAHSICKGLSAGISALSSPDLGLLLLCHQKTVLRLWDVYLLIFDQRDQ